MIATRRRAPRGVPFLVAIATAVIFACTTDTLIGPKDVAVLVIAPDTVVMPVGDTILLEGVATDSRGVKYIGEKITWTSSDQSIVTITADGHLISVAVGTATVTASAGGKSASAQVTVTPQAAIATSADSIGFAAVARGPLPATQKVVITNGSAGFLTGLTTGNPVYTGPDTGWLYLTSTSGTAPDTIVLSVSLDTFPVGTYTATFPVTATKATNSPHSIKVTLTLTAGAPSAVLKTAGDSQTAVVKTAVTTAPSVTVKDAYGTAIPNVSVTFTTTAGNGTLTGATTTTNASGIATLGSWTLDTIAKTDTLTATVAALPPVEFTAVATAAGANQIVKTAGDAQAAPVSTTLPTAPSVTVRDKYGNPVSGVTVTFAATAPNGSVTGATPTTNAQGAATVGSWTLGTLARTDSLSASVSGVGAPAVFTATAAAGSASAMVKNAGGTTGTVNTNVSPTPAVLVTDQFGNPVSGVTVTFAATAANGSVTGGSVATNGTGVATVGSFKLSTAARTDTLTASAPGLPSVSFIVTAGADVPNTAAKNGGDGQTAAAGSTLPTNPSVLVKDQYGNPVPGFAVTFVVATGGGAVTGGNATTNASGIATVGSWQLGNSTGSNSLTATVAALPVLTFTATAVAGTPTTIARLSPASQSDTIGATAGTDSVLVTDQLGNPVSGVTVTWGIGGAGTLTPFSAATNASGVAKATRVLGTAPGTVTDSALASGLTGSPVTFTVTTSAGHAATLVKGAGDGQTDTAGATLPIAYADSVKDRAGNPVAGVTVAWGVSGGGSITPSSISGANGVATATRVLGPTAGVQTASGTAAGLAGSPTSFSATATHGNAKTLAIVAGTNAQSATAGTAVASPPSVKIADQFANPVSGVTVTFALGAGGSRNGTITGATPTTNASGVATLTTWTLGSAAGPDTVTATVAGLTGSPAVFVDTSKTGSASLISAAGGNGQTDSVGGTLPRLDSVKVTDAALNPVSGVTVTWSVTKGGGSITPSSITNANGIATAQWILGDTAGAQTATATSGGLSGSPVTFSATATAGAPTSLTKNGGDGQTVAAGTAVPTALSVLVKDQFNNPVSGATVTFAAVGASNGNVTGATPVTSASGIATLGSWTVGNSAKTDSVTATIGALSTTFTATVTAGSAANLARLGAASQSDTIGGTLPALDSVKVTDQFGNPVAGTTVTWAIGGAGSLTPTSPTTNAQGIATATRVLGTAAGAATDTAKAAGLTGSPVTFGVTTTAGQGATLIKGAGDAQTDTVAATLAIAYTDTVKDRAGNPVSGVTVTWGVTGGGSITPTSITGANGVASATRVLGTVAGSQGATATVAGLTGSPVSFTATANHGAAKVLSAAAGTNGQAATVGTAVATTPGAKVTDQFGNPVSGVSVTFALAAGGARNGSITGTTPTTNGSGVATLGTWTLGAFAGPDTVVATSAGLTGSPFNFIDFGNSGTATTMSLAGGNAQSDTVLATLPKLDSVKVTDGVNPVSGVTVSWAVTSGGGSLPATSITDGTGIAVAQWTLGPTAGTQTAIASVGGLTGSPVGFTATATHGNAKLIAVNAGDLQSATVNTPVTAPSVIVHDNHGNVVPGVTVTFASTVRSGTVTGGTPVTDASGIATVGSWTLGSTAGPDTLTATAAGLTGSPVLILATGTAGAATNIARLGAASQSDTIGATLAALDSVKVTDGSGNPVSGVTVTWAAGGAGTLTPTSGTTNASGIATATRVLGSTAGVVADTAKAAGLTGSPITFTVTTNAGHATTIGLNGGDAQTDTVGATLATAYSVLVTDRGGNPVSGTTVTWGVSGGGSITPSSISGVNGLATATRVLGTVTGTQGATATAAGLSGSPVPFSATATAGHATTMTEVAGTNGQSGTVGTAIGTPPAMKVTDQFGNVVPGVTVTFALGAGGARNGSITGPNPATNASGVATLGTWTLGNTAGPDTVIASSAGLTGTGHVFVDFGSAGSATTIALAGGNGQTDTVKSVLPRLDSVLVTDALSNPVSGVTVNWAVTSGGGSIAPSSVTDGNGIAVAQWTLGSTAGTQTATATNVSLTGSPVTFSATATHGNATTIGVNTGNGQSATVNTAVATAPSVIVTDAYGNPVSGVGVTFAVTGGGGSLTGATPTTNASGIATLGSWTLGTVAGANTMTATSGTLGGSPVPFSAIGTAGTPTQMSVNAGNNQTAQINTTLPTAPSVLVQDAFNNPVPGFTVNFSTAAGNNGGLTAPLAPATDVSGIATVGSWVTGSVVKNDTLTASGTGVPTVTFVATVTPGSASSMAINGGNAQADTIGATLPALSVIVKDAGNNPVPGVTVNWAVTAGSATRSPASSVTDANGIASDTVALGTITGGVTVQATSGLLTPVNFAETVNPGNPTTIAQNGGNGQSATVNTAVATAPSVKVTDRAGNGVPGVGVTFTVAATNGSVTGGSTSTASNGVATVGSWTLDSIASRANTLTATAAVGLTGNPVTFSATGVAGSLSTAKSTLTAGTASITACSTSCVAGSTASTITATELDQFGNPISGGFILFQSTGSANTFSPASGSTNASGVLTASFNSTKAEGKTISVTGGITQTPGVTVVHDVVSAATSTVAATSPITASTGTSKSSVTITLLDQFLNPVSGLQDTIWIGGNTGTNVIITQPGLSNVNGQSFGTFSKTTAQSTNVFAFINSIGLFTSNFATVTVNAAAPSTVTVTNGGFSARVGTGVATRPTYTVRDAFNNLVPSFAITISSTGGGTPSPTSGSTNASGQFTLTSWTMGGTAVDAANGTMSNTATLTAGSATGTATDFGIYTWSGDAISLLSTGSSCNVSCHAWTYANMVGQASGCGSLPTLIVAGAAGSSDVYNKLSSSAPTCGGGQMPAGGPFYSTAQLKIVRAWINNGALNN